MNTQHLKYAVEVEKTGSITQAADNLYIGQPSLSKAIKELEETLGITIFRRTSKGAQPTEKGSEFLGYAKTVLQQIEKMEMLYRPNSPETQSLRIAVPRGGYIAAAVAEFVNRLDAGREIDVRVKETNSIRAIHDIATGDFPMGVIRYESQHEGYFLDYLSGKGLDCEAIWEFDHLVAMSAAHPLAERAEITGEELKEYVEIVHGGSAAPSAPDAAREIAGEMGKRRIRVYERFSQFELLHKIPTAYMWVSPIPQHMLDRYGLIQRRCAGAGRKCKDVLAYQRGRTFTPVERQFIDRLYQAKNSVAFLRVGEQPPKWHAEIE